MKWIKVQGCHGIPMTYSSVAQATTEILGKQVGEMWLKQYCKSPPDLKMKKTMGLEKACIEEYISVHMGAGKL